MNQFTFQCLDAEFDYGYEYIGSSPREVITPLTERVFISLTQAMKAHMGGMLVGSMVSVNSGVKLAASCFSLWFFILNAIIVWLVIFLLL